MGVSIPMSKQVTKHGNGLDEKKKSIPSSQFMRSKCGLRATLSLKGQDNIDKKKRSQQWLELGFKRIKGMSKEEKRWLSLGLELGLKLSSGITF